MRVWRYFCTLMCILAGTAHSLSQGANVPHDSDPLYFVVPIRGDTESLASQYWLGTKWLADRLSYAPAGVGKGLSEARTGELALVFGLFVPKFVLQHEYGHVRAAVSLGGQANVHLLSWIRGETHHWGADFPGGPRDSVIFAAGGVNLGQKIARFAYDRWGEEGSLSYQEALEYMIGCSHVALYALLDFPGSKNDIRGYVRDVSSEAKTSLGEIQLITSLCTLASAPVWSALRAQRDFIRDGTREVSLPTMRVFGREITSPNFTTYLTYQGIVIGADTFVDRADRRRSALSLHVRYRGDGQAVGLRFYGIRLSDDLSVSPFVRVTRDAKYGFATGVEAKYGLKSGYGLVARLEYQNHDLIAEPEGRPTGFTAFVGIAVGP